MIERLTIGNRRVGIPSESGSIQEVSHLTPVSTRATWGSPRKYSPWDGRPGPVLPVGDRDRARGLGCAAVADALLRVGRRGAARQGARSRLALAGWARAGPGRNRIRIVVGHGRRGTEMGCGRGHD